MARKAPKQKTIKRLFALSGNTCAYPDCDKAMVGQDGTVLGEVCHIEAAEEGGERYNPNQTDEERRAFENLVLLCGDHHKVTNNVEEYPVKRLQEIKAAHEKQYEERPYSVPAGLVEQVRDALQAQYQISNTGSGTQIVRVGLGYSDVKTIVHDLFVANFPKLQEVARRAADEHVRQFGEILLQQVSDEIEPNDLEDLADPDVQFVLSEATQAAARSGEKYLLELLSTVMVKRLKSDRSSLLAHATGEAVRVAKKLTERQLKTLAARFVLIEYRLSRRFTLPQEGADYFEHFFPTISGYSKNHSDYRHLLSCGCLFNLQANIPELRQSIAHICWQEWKDESLKGQLKHFGFEKNITGFSLTPVGIVLAGCYIQTRLKEGIEFDVLLDEPIEGSTADMGEMLQNIRDLELKEKERKDIKLRRRFEVR